MSNRTRYFITFTGTPTDQYHGAHLNADGSYVIEHYMSTIVDDFVIARRVAAALRNEYPGVWSDDMAVTGVVDAYTGRTIEVRATAYPDVEVGTVDMVAAVLADHVKTHHEAVDPADYGYQFATARRAPRSVMPVDVLTAVQGVGNLASTPFDDRDEAAPLRDVHDVLDALVGAALHIDDVNRNDNGILSTFGEGARDGLRVAGATVREHGPRRATVLIAIMRQYAIADAVDGTDRDYNNGRAAGYACALQVLDGYDVANDPAYVK